jgi:hypothetical protein
MRSLIALMIAAVVLAMAGPAVGADAALPPGGTFVDDDTSPHQGTIEAIALAGLTRGCNPPENDRFCPDEPVTRGEMAAFLVRALDLPAGGNAGFTDTYDSIFDADIQRLAGAGITRGCNPPDNDRFCPDEPVTRGEMAAFLVRALDLPEVTADFFSDDDGSIFENAIERLRGAGITLGCNPPDNNEFCPNRPVTRAEMATFLSRALHLDPVPVPERPYQIEVVSREDWGAAPARGTYVSQNIDEITIHHAGSWDGVTGPAQFRSWQSWHFHLGWPDIAYHFIVGLDGKVYEGRPYSAAGDTATEYDPSGHLLIVVEGDFDVVTPTADQVEMLAEMVAWGSQQFDVDVATVNGHRDLAATTCPGENLYALIKDGTIASRAAQIISDGGVTLSFSS